MRKIIIGQNILKNASQNSSIKILLMKVFSKANKEKKSILALQLLFDH